jgi:hypothetical protein
MRQWIIEEEVIKHMKVDWELGYGEGIRCRGNYWLQKGGLCKGGDTIDVHSKTVDKLIAKNLIESYKLKDDQFWLTRYRIKKGANKYD